MVYAPINTYSIFSSRPGTHKRYFLPWPLKKVFEGTRIPQWPLTQKFQVKGQVSRLEHNAIYTLLPKRSPHTCRTKRNNTS